MLMLGNGQIGMNDLVWSEGMEHWVPASQLFQTRASHQSVQPHYQTRYTGAHKQDNTLIGQIGKVTGMGSLYGFSLKSLFSDVFKKHTLEDAEAVFDAGTPLTSPDLAKVNLAWPRPWLFSRLLLGSIFLTIGLYWGILRFENYLLVPAWIFVGCYLVPFATMIFFFEVNSLKNISLYRCLSLFVKGGVLSILISLFLFENFDFLNTWLGAMSAGIIEESGKLAIAIFITRHWKFHYWILNGMLIGSSIGCGFAAFETGGYVFFDLVAALMDFESSMEFTMLIRAVLSPFNHVVWTSLATGALWSVKQDQPFQYTMLIDKRFLRVFILVVILHMLWNSPLDFNFFGGGLDWISIRIVLGLVAWAAIFLMLQKALGQVVCYLKTLNHPHIMKGAHHE